MPYINKDSRPRAIVEGPVSSGELNYIFTRAINSYLRYHTSNYQTFNDILGALEGCKLEFNRRIVIPYEDEKIKENGDVY